jgi:hypothetical protein
MLRLYVARLFTAEPDPRLDSAGGCGEGADISSDLGLSDCAAVLPSMTPGLDVADMPTPTPDTPLSLQKSTQSARVYQQLQNLIKLSWNAHMFCTNPNMLRPVVQHGVVAEQVQS